MMIRRLQDTFTILLTQDQVTFVDEKDFYRLRKHNWRAQWDPSTKSFYAKRTVKVGRKRASQFLHRFILGLERGDKRQGDHINHDTLDNRRYNLRIVSNRKNCENKRYHSKYGVGICKMGNRFQALFRVGGRRRSIGCFDTPEEARQARKEFMEDNGLI